MAAVYREGMSLPDRVHGLRRPAASTLSCADTCSCGEKRHFSQRSEDGASVMYGLEKVLHHHRSDRWIFCDGEAETQAMELRFAVGSQDLRVPPRVTRRIANPTNAGFSVEKRSATEVNLNVTGPNNGGINRLHLEYKDGQLVRAWTRAVNDLEPEVVFP